LGVGFERYGSEEELVRDPIRHLYHVYVRINQVIKEEQEAEKLKAEEEKTKVEEEKVKAEEGEAKKAEEKEAGVKPTYNGPTDDEARAFFARMEAGDADAVALWKRFRELSIEKYKDAYARLNIEYDVYSGESQVSKEAMETVKTMMKEKGLSEESYGAVIVDLTKYSKKLGKAMVQKNDGTSLYLTRDIGAAMERYQKYNFDKMIYVVATQQDLHLQQLFKILELLGFEWANRCQHVNFGMVLGMSTRKGTVVFLDDILAEAKERMHEVMRKNAEKYSQVDDPEYVANNVGRTGVMIQDMSGKRYSPPLRLYTPPN
jgi:arginyl-tRNA synthetase